MINRKYKSVANHEYSRLPYMVDDGFEDIQRSTSEKYIQDNYGKFDESEYQQSYKNDDDYQALEYNYSLPQFDFDLSTPDIDFGNAVPKDIDCDKLWEQLFPDHPLSSGPFIPNRNDLSRLAVYAKRCPVVYKDHMCCGRGLKIQGPTNGELCSEGNFSFNVGNKPKDCEYDFWARKGVMKSWGDYTAPYVTEDTEDTLGIYPWTGVSGIGDTNCLTWKVKIKVCEECKGVIGYTTLQMSVSQTQTLTVVGWKAGEVYLWETTSGSINPSTGNSVTYTAPATNANCANNPTITLSCGGNVVDTITIAISITNNYKAYTYKETWPQEPSNPCGDLGGSCHGAIYYFRMAAFDCMGQPYKWSGTPVTCTSYWCNGASPCTQESEISCYGLGTLGPFPGSMQDNRTVAQKTAGCCPAQLI